MFVKKPQPKTTEKKKEEDIDPGKVATGDFDKFRKKKEKDPAKVITSDFDRFRKSKKKKQKSA